MHRMDMRSREQYLKALLGRYLRALTVDSDVPLTVPTFPWDPVFDLCG
jgi:hypothetical protein